MGIIYAQFLSTIPALCLVHASAYDNYVLISCHPYSSAYDIFLLPKNLVLSLHELDVTVYLDVFL